MVRSVGSITMGVGIVLMASGAQAQQGPLPGAGDSTKISTGNANTQSEYNRLIGAGNPKPAATDDDRHPRSSNAVAATAADLKAGSSLRDVKGVAIGTVSQVDPDGVIVDTGKTKIKVPASAFGKDDQGLLLPITASRFNELIAQTQAAH